MFLSVEWAKRWLPAVFLLLSLFLPWWTWARMQYYPPTKLSETDLLLSFPWEDSLFLNWIHYSNVILIRFDVLVYEIPRLLFVSVLIVVAGLCGIFGRNKIRNIGGLVGIVGIVSYFFLVFPLSTKIWEISQYMRETVGGNPFFGLNFVDNSVKDTFIWFLSPGFFLALAGSLMLLSPIIRTGIARLRKRLSSPKQAIKEPVK